MDVNEVFRAFETRRKDYVYKDERDTPFGEFCSGWFSYQEAIEPNLKRLEQAYSILSNQEAKLQIDFQEEIYRRKVAQESRDTWKEHYFSVKEELDQLKTKKQDEFALYGYATPSGKLYASGMAALSNGEQSWVKVYVKEEGLK